MFDSEDSTHKTEFGTSRGKIVLHLLENPVGNQFLKVLRILVPPEILVPLEICARFGESLLMFNWIFFQIPYIKKVFPLMIQWQSVILQKNLHKTNIYVYDLRILVSSSILVVPWIFEKHLEILLKDNSLILKIPCNKVILTVIISKHSR